MELNGARGDIKACIAIRTYSKISLFLAAESDTNKPSSGSTYNNGIIYTVYSFWYIR